MAGRIPDGFTVGAQISVGEIYEGRWLHIDVPPTLIPVAKKSNNQVVNVFDDR
jgi:hypothetical protein